MSIDGRWSIEEVRGDKVALARLRVCKVKGGLLERIRTKQKLSRSHTLSYVRLVREVRRNLKWTSEIRRGFRENSS